MTCEPQSFPAVPSGGKASGSRVSYPPAQLPLADHWMQAWRQLGGTVTIDVRDMLNPWLVQQGDIAAAEDATALFDELMTTPGLAIAVRTLIEASFDPANRRFA